MTQMHNDTALGFLSRYFENTKDNIELRAFTGKRNEGPVARLFSRDLDEIDSFLKKSARLHIYFGCATREGNDYGDKDHCRELPALYTEIDFKSFTTISEEMREPHAKSLIESFRLKPSIIIYSGGGYHLYWLLNQPILLKQDARIELVLKWIGKETSADPAVAEIARVLRLPGTLNHKYKPVREVLIVESDWGQRYQLDDFLKLIPERGAESEEDFNGIDLYSTETIPLGQHDTELTSRPLKNRAERAISRLV